jgi:RNA polymerase sigma-70 factor (ECF subfamily)
MTPASGDRPPASAGESRMEALVRAVATLKDRTAFAELFQHFAPRLKAFMMKGGADSDTAEELAQEAMIQVWRRAESFDPCAQRPPDLRSRAKSASTASAATLPMSEEGMRTRWANPNAATRPPGAARPSAAGARRILPEDQATVVKMAFCEDKSHSAIAAELPYRWEPSNRASDWRSPGCVE